MEFAGFRIILLLALMFWRQPGWANCTWLSKSPLAVDEVPSQLYDEHQDGSSAAKTMTEIDCRNGVLSYLSYACANRVNLVVEKIRLGCLAPYSYANRLCSQDVETVSEDMRQLLLMVRERRRPDSGNAGTGTYPPGFMASRGRRNGYDASHQREQRKEGGDAASGTEDFPNMYVNGFVGARG